MDSFKRFVRTIKIRGDQACSHVKNYYVVWKKIAKKQREHERILAECPDERSREIKRRELDAELNDSIAIAQRKANQYRRIMNGLAKMMNAVVARYTYPKNTFITKAQYEKAPEVFESAKEQMLITIRWMRATYPDCPFTDEYVEMLSSATIESYQSPGEWLTFFEELQSHHVIPTDSTDSTDSGSA